MTKKWTLLENLKVELNDAFHENSRLQTYHEEYTETNTQKITRINITILQ